MTNVLTTVILVTFVWLSGGAICMTLDLHHCLLCLSSSETTHTSFMYTRLWWPWLCWIWPLIPSNEGDTTSKPSISWIRHINVWGLENIPNKSDNNVQRGIKNPTAICWSNIWVHCMTHYLLAQTCPFLFTTVHICISECALIIIPVICIGHDSITGLAAFTLLQFFDDYGAKPLNNTTLVQ